MEVTMANDWARRRGRLMVHQPFHGGPKPVEPVTPDAVVETGEQAIKGHVIAGSNSVHRREERARVEGMEAQLHLGERRRHTEPSLAEHRPADHLPLRRQSQIALSDRSIRRSMRAVMSATDTPFATRSPTTPRWRSETTSARSLTPLRSASSTRAAPAL